MELPGVRYTTTLENVQPSKGLKHPPLFFQAQDSHLPLWCNKSFFLSSFRKHSRNRSRLLVQTHNHYSRASQDPNLSSKRAGVSSKRKTTFFVYEALSLFLSGSACPLRKGVKTAKQFFLLRSFYWFPFRPWTLDSLKVKLKVI